MSISIVAATSWEAKPIARGLKYGRKKAPVSLGVCGIGRELAHTYTQKVLKLEKPSFLMIAGFSGALQSHLKPGDIIIDEEGDKRSVDWCEKILKGMGLRYYIGGITQSEKIMTTQEEKLKIGNKTGALAVDMESETLKKWAQNEKVPHVVVRSIIDGTEDRLFSDWPANDSVKESIKFVWNHKGQLGTLINVGSQFWKAKTSLSQFVSHYFFALKDV